MAPAGSIHSHYCSKIKCNHICMAFSTISYKPFSFACQTSACHPTLLPTAEGHILPFVCSHSLKTSKKSFSKAPPGPCCSHRITAIEGFLPLSFTSASSISALGTTRCWTSTAAHSEDLWLCQCYKYCRRNYSSSG